MAKKAFHIYPSAVKELEELGQRLRDARLRRRFSMDTVCARADISRPTLCKVEQGDPSVALGAYLQVLRVLGLVSDLSFLAKEDSLGRQLQDEELPRRRRIARVKPVTGTDDGSNSH